MSVIAPAAAAMHPLRTPEPMEGPGPDRDADQDDKKVSPSQAVPQTTPKGLGVAVNTTA